MIKLSISIILSLGLLITTSTLLAESDINATWKQKRAEYYQPFSIDHLTQAEFVFENILLDLIDPDLIKELQSMNLSLLRMQEYIIISENTPPFSGQGLFVIRLANEIPIFLQAPHSFYDSKTGAIAIKMMQENKIKALALNTVNRYYTKSKGDNNADMAHLSNSLFVAFSRAFNKVYKNAQVLQLHGFNANKRKETQSVDIILSNGTRAISQELITQADCIEKQLGINSSVYPVEISVLGGTTNTIGRALRKQGVSGFKHIEMSLAIREKLNRSEKNRRSFIRCLEQ